MRSLCFRVAFIFLLTGCFLILTPSVKAATETTLYLGSVEKNLESGETKVYYQAGTASVVRTIKQDGSSQVSYLHSDHLGSTILITNDKGNVEGPSLAYYPYGNLTSDQKQLTIDKLYTGQRKDTSSDLYFYNARYYNPTTARFISADKAEGGNRYAYVANNPIMRNDPSGNRIFEISQGQNCSGILVGSSCFINEGFSKTPSKEYYDFAKIYYDALVSNYEAKMNRKVFKKMGDEEIPYVSIVNNYLIEPIPEVKIFDKTANVNLVKLVWSLGFRDQGKAPANKDFSMMVALSIQETLLSNPNSRNPDGNDAGLYQINSTWADKNNKVRMFNDSSNIYFPTGLEYINYYQSNPSSSSYKSNVYTPEINAFLGAALMDYAINKVVIGDYQDVIDPEDSTNKIQSTYGGFYHHYRNHPTEVLGRKTALFQDIMEGNITY